MKKRRGFTLTELVIVMAVSSILFSSVLVLTIATNNYASDRSHESDICDELTEASGFILAVFSKHDNIDSEIPGTDKLFVSDSLLSYDGETINVEYIKDVSLIVRGNLYKYTFFFTNDGIYEYTLLLIRRSAV